MTFPGETPVTVTAPSLQEMGMFETGRAYGTWPAVLEKAHGLWKERRPWYDKVFASGSGSSDSPAEGADGGDTLNAGIRILTGKDSETLDLNTTSTNRKIEVADTLQRSLQNRKVFTCDTHGGEDVPGPPSGHAYSVIAYDPATKTVMIRNPPRSR